MVLTKVFLCVIFNTDNTVYAVLCVGEKLKQCVYMQIVERIKRMCELGLYGDDGKLPSCREFAIEMGVNPNTVQRAYNQLEEDGYVTASPKKGYFVTAVNSRRESAAIDKIKELKAAGFTRAELCNIVNTVYGEYDD